MRLIVGPGIVKKGLVFSHGDTNCLLFVPTLGLVNQ